MPCKRYNEYGEESPSGRYNDCGEDLLMKYTGYRSEAEAEYYESGQYEIDQQAEKEARYEAEREALINLAEELGLSENCAKNCYHFYELAEGFFDDDFAVTTEQADFLKAWCCSCKGKAEGKPDEAMQKIKDKQFDDLQAFIEHNGMKYGHCTWCSKLYEVFGKFKDPDDEWKALEERCGKCQYWGNE